MLKRLLRPLPLLLVAFAFAPALRAQGLGAGCDREATTAIRFGVAGGDLPPASTEITPEGVVRRRNEHAVVATLGRVPRDTARALTRRALRGGFWALPPAPHTEPTAPRRFVELLSACGMHHVEYDTGHESRLFSELYRRLTRLTSTMGRRRK